MPPIPYRLANATGSDQADEWMRLGTQDQIDGKLPQAQARYNQALRLDPRHALATNNLAILFAQSNMLNEALLTIERASMFDGEHAFIDTNWAMMLMDSERTDEALTVARRSLAKKQCVESRFALAFLLPQCGEAAAAVSLYNQILDEDPKQSAAATNACGMGSLQRVLLCSSRLRGRLARW
jgi:tetratricopeptide (TPR) repeat protein